MNNNDAGVDTENDANADGRHQEGDYKGYKSLFTIPIHGHGSQPESVTM